MDTPKVTVVGIVTPHLLRVVDLANQAEKGVNVDWHVRQSVTGSMAELGELYTAPVAIASYVEGLERAAAQATRNRKPYIQVLLAAVETARRLRRE